jgi:hypothetical protein
MKIRQDLRHADQMGHVIVAGEALLALMSAFGELISLLNNRLFGLMLGRGRAGSGQVDFIDEGLETHN